MPQRKGCASAYQEADHFLMKGRSRNGCCGESVALGAQAAGERVPHPVVASDRVDVVREMGDSAARGAEIR